MGCDIHGAIEGRYEDRRWRYVADVGSLVGRNYEVFGFLWGVRNYGNFEPQFPKRGFPEGMSLLLTFEARGWILDDAELEEELGRVDFHSASWATMDELHSIDWEQKAEGLDGRISILDENKEPTGSKAGGFGIASGWWDILNEGDNRERLDRGEAIPNEDETRYIQRRRLTAKETLSGSWEWLIWDLMPTVEERFDESRMVVWFDN